MSETSMIKKSKGRHSVSLFIDKNRAVYFDPFEIEYIPQEVLNKIKDKSITHNMFGIQDNKSIMCGFYLFFPNDYKKNDKIIYKYFEMLQLRAKFETEMVSCSKFI